MFSEIDPFESVSSGTTLVVGCWLLVLDWGEEPRRATQIPEIIHLKILYTIYSR
jgi:hypothetical protein